MNVRGDKYSPGRAPIPPDLSDMVPTYLFCGSGDMYGGVQKYTADVASYMREVEGMYPHVFIGSSAAKAALQVPQRARNEEDWQTVEQLFEVFSGFNPGTAHILSSNAEFRAENGSQNPNQLKALVNPLSLAREIRAVGPDVGHVMLPMWPHIGGFAVRHLLKNDIPVIGTYHIDSSDPKTNRATRAAGFIDRKLLERMHSMIAVSPVAEDHLRNFYGYRGDVEVIPCPVNDEFFAHTEPDQAFKEKYAELMDPEKKTLLFVGRPDQRKGLGELIEAFSTLLQSNDGQEVAVQLIVCGDGAERERFEKLAEARGIRNHVHFVGRVDEREKAMFLKYSDGVVLPALKNESLGITVIEAIAAGKWVVVGDNPGYRGVVGKLASAEDILINPRDTRGLVNIMGRLITDEVFAKAVQEDQQSALDPYRQKVVGAQIAQHYQLVLAA